jgi:hypothetical protein
MHHEEESKIRERLKELKTFYTNLVIYGGVSIACILIWLLTGAGAFWPIWPIFGFALAALLQGIRLGALPMLEDIFPFLKPDWEEKQLESYEKNHEISTAMTPTPRTKPRSKDKEE